VSFDSYAEEENFYVSVAHELGLTGWDLDRLLYTFTDEILAALAAPPVTVHPSCVFCVHSADRVILSTPFAVAIQDAFPLTHGHTLVISRRHVASLFELTEAEQCGVWALVATVRARLGRELRVTAFNIGVNDGTAAGQTVDHAHVHVIPRSAGDVRDPRGGIRCVIPEKAKYWAD
jgi:diadenosine tetraphosphate (Ap4A) HIT family hydrolase